MVRILILTKRLSTGSLGWKFSMMRMALLWRINHVCVDVTLAPPQAINPHRKCESECLVVFCW